MKGTAQWQSVRDAVKGFHLTPPYMANPIFSCMYQHGKFSCSQSACYRVIQNTAYCRLWFLFQDSFLFIPFCAKYNKQNRS